MYSSELIQDAIKVVEERMKGRGVTGQLYKQVDQDLERAWDHGVEADCYGKALGYLMRAHARLVKAGKFRVTELLVK